MAAVWLPTPSWASTKKDDLLKGILGVTGSIKLCKLQQYFCLFCPFILPFCRYLVARRRPSILDKGKEAISTTHGKQEVRSEQICGNGYVRIERERESVNKKMFWRFRSKKQVVQNMHLQLMKGKRRHNLSGSEFPSKEGTTFCDQKRYNPICSKRLLTWWTHYEVTNPNLVILRDIHRLNRRGSTYLA